ncbi:MAG: NAD(P)/FAD-dependent oxidoreductase [Rhodobacter sp.]|nr:NAD(P)/FAD-dependent oxidoreductase [Rhodobacter sp.]
MRSIIIGAGPAGLAAAACLKRAGLAVEIFERSDRIGPAWHRHYDRLVLHTSRGRSALPFRPMPSRVPKYPSRQDVIDYLEDYADAFGLAPRFGCAVASVHSTAEGWRVRHAEGDTQAEVVVFATGLNGHARRPDWPGLAAFPGQVLHSSDYRDAAAFAGQRVLVVGFGNSGADIATDLAEAAVDTGLSVRGPVNLLPKEILGIPATSLGLLRKLFPPAVADRLTAPVVRALIGRPDAYGMVASDKGPMRQVLEDGKIPMIDAGALAQIKAGRVAVYPGIARIEGRTVVFADGRRADFDAVVTATGYGLDLKQMLPDAAGDVLDGSGRPRVSGGPTGRCGLYFCSYHVSPNGQLRQAAMEAQAIAADVSRLATADQTAARTAG